MLRKIGRKYAIFAASALRNAAHNLFFCPSPTVAKHSHGIQIKTPAASKMRVAGRLASKSSTTSNPSSRPASPPRNSTASATTTWSISRVHPGPAQLRPRRLQAPHPKSICASINHQVCHGVPGDKAPKNGDIVNLDITTIKEGFHGDTSRMFVVGEGSIQAWRLCEITFECLWLGISPCGPGFPG